MSRQVNATICGRKISGYPRLTYAIGFETLDELLIKIDKKIEETDFGKVDVYLDDDSIFDSLELERLDKEWIMFE